MNSDISRRRALATIGACAAATVTAAIAVAARSATSTAFDPAAWLREAERRGYDVFLWDGRGDGRLGLYIGERDECYPEQYGSDEMELWHALRPSPAGRQANERALRGYLLEIGRVLS